MNQPLIKELALWCQQYSPLTAISPPDGIFIDITGCAHLFGGEAGLRRHLLARLPDVRIAIADHAAAAWALARYGTDELEDVRPLPLAALGLPAATITKLRRVGIRQVGQLMRLPAAQLRARYGAEPGLRLAQALGTAPLALQFISPPPDWREIEHHAEPIFAPVQLQAALQRLVTTLCRALSLAMRGATELTARFHRIDRQCPDFTLGFAAPSRDETHIFRLLHEKLNLIDPGFGVEAISLTAGRTEPLCYVQSSTGPQPADYSRTIDIMLNRLGPGQLWRAAPHASHIPEHAARRQPVMAPAAAWPAVRHPRPVQLLARPVAISAIAPVPDDPPVLFTWRGTTHRIRHATGPERIARDWWRHEHDDARPEVDFIRDYYAVEDSAGARFWLFRAGTHQGIAPPRWYLHGFG